MVHAGMISLLFFAIDYDKYVIFIATTRLIVKHPLNFLCTKGPSNFVFLVTLFSWKLFKVIFFVQRKFIG